MYATTSWAPSARSTVTTSQSPAANAAASADSSRRQLEALFPNSTPLDSAFGNNTPARPQSIAPRRSFGRPLSSRTMKLSIMLQGMSDATAANNDDAFRKAVDPFLRDHELPDDPEVLRRMLYHPDDVVLCRVMGHISGLLLQRRMDASPVLASTLNDVAKRQDLGLNTKSCLDGLRQQMDAQRPRK